MGNFEFYPKIYGYTEIWVNSEILEIMGSENMGKFLEIDKYG